MENNNIHFHYLLPAFYFPQRSLLKNFLLQSIKKEGRSVDTINYIFCTDENLLEINRSYLKHDTYTDIITFELSGKEQPLIADIYISVERVKENATIFKTPFKKELLRVIFHGALHLCGYKDKAKKDTAIMRDKEHELLIKYQKFHVKHFNK